MSKAPSIPFGQRRIGAEVPVVVIAEIGINHEGSSETCIRMIEAASAAGADAVKLQTMDADANYARGSESHALFSRAALGREETARMFAFARALGIEPFTTCGDFATLEWVERLEPAAHKISSGLLTHLPFIRRAAATGRTLLISTGMATPTEVDEALAAAQSGGPAPVGLLQCTSLYPAPPETLNLAAIGWLARRYEVPVGFSDHSLGTAAAGLAVAAGARMIEKHFTLDPGRPGFDHALALDPKGFARLVAEVRAAETMLGRAQKTPVAEERVRAPRLRRCLVAARRVAAGEPFSTDNLALKRPAGESHGLPPRHFEAVLGRRALRELAPDEPVTADSVEGIG